MKTKTIYLASNNIDDDGDFNQKAFEKEEDVIDFCKKHNAEPYNEDWGCHEITYYYSGI